MKTNRMLKLAFLVLILAQPLVNISIHSADADPDIWHVPDDYPTIQDAIDAANVGDTIIVQNGTYREDIDIDKRLIILGEDKEITIIDGLGAPQVVDIKARDVKFRGFTVINGSMGIFIDSADRTIVSDCVVYNCTWVGVRSYSSTGISILNCAIYNTDSGISVDCSCFIEIVNSVCHNNTYDGIEIYDSDYIQIIDCDTYYNTWDGIYLSHSNVASICNTSIHDNDYDGIAIYGSEKFYASRSSVYDNDDNGIYFGESEGVVVNCNITGNNYGLFPIDSNARIKYCSIEDNLGYGIYSWSSSTNATECWWGDASGPYHPSLNPSGTGDMASDDVEFDPWQTELYQPAALISDLRCHLSEIAWSVVYPDQETPKPLGCGAAWVSDWLASAFVTTKLENYIEGLDTDDAFVDQITGKAVGDPGTGILTFGGQFVNPVVKRAESDGTPDSDRAPVKFYLDDGIFRFQYKNGTNIPGAWLPQSVINVDEDLFLIERYLDEDGRYVMICYGFGWPGTYAAGKFFDSVVFEHLGLFTDGWIIVHWDDTNDDGFVNNPGEGDTYTLIVAGP